MVCSQIVDGVGEDVLEVEDVSSAEPQDDAKSQPPPQGADKSTPAAEGEDLTSTIEVQDVEVEKSEEPSRPDAESQPSGYDAGMLRNGKPRP